MRAICPQHKHTKPGKTLLLAAALILIAVCTPRVLSADVPSTAPQPLYHETLRPQFHFTARYWDEYQLHPPNHHEGWINDLNGLVYNDGTYHLFAQRWWSAWLHATSADLIHWTELPPAFGKGGRFGGTQSGGAVVDHNNTSGLGDGKTPPIIAFWSSTDNLNQCISYSLDKGRTWTKYDKNPVLVHRFRDPNVFWYEADKKWIMILYGPSDQVRPRGAYGFNGEENDAHDLRPFEPGQWICSAVRLFDDGRVVASDAQGAAEARIDINKENLSSDMFRVGAKTIDSEFLEGDVAEILIYNKPLTDTETQNTLAALHGKWGPGDSTPAMPIPTEGLVLHLNAAHVDTNSQGAVSLWPDLSGRGNDAKQPAADRMPKRIADSAGRPAVRFDGAQFLQGPAVLAEGDDTFTLIALWRRDHANGSQVICEQNAATRQPGRRAALLTVSRDETPNVYLLFASTNLLDWKQLDTEIPDSFECPDMFPLPIDGDAARTKWVVVDGGGNYVLGRFDGQQFTTESPKQRGDCGRNFYATMTFENMPPSDPRRIQLAWMRGWDDYPKDMPFNQQISFPCELTLHTLPRGIVMYRYPIREIATLYDRTFSLQDYTLNPGENPLAALQGDLFDFSLEIDTAQSTCSQITLNLRGNIVSYDLNRKVLSSVGSEAPLQPQAGRIQIRTLMDRLSIETFGNRGEVSITNVAYQNTASPHLQLQTLNGRAKITTLTAHTLKSIWP